MLVWSLLRRVSGENGRWAALLAFAALSSAMLYLAITGLLFWDVPIRSIMSSQYAVHLSFGLITGAVLAILLYRREHLYFRISRFLLAGIDGMIFAACVCGASLSFSFLAEGISTIPLAIAIGAALQSYALVLAFFAVFRTVVRSNIA